MTEAERVAITGHPIVLYDGVCGLCNRVVRLLLRVDRAEVLRFVPLESALAAELLVAFPTSSSEPEGVLLLADALTPSQTIYRRFEAVAEAMLRIQGPFPLFGRLLRLVPQGLREWSYGLIARHRYQLFGRYSTCPVPTPAQRGRILGV